MWNLQHAFSEFGKKRITKFECFHLRSEVPLEYEFPVASFVENGSMFFKITTETGMVGWGEPSPYQENILASKKEIEQIVEPFLVDSSLASIIKTLDSSNEALTHVNGVEAGLLQAIFDVIGKEAGLSICDLITGQKRKKNIEIRAYASGGMYFDDQPLELFLKELKGVIEEGFSAWKFRPRMPRGQDHIQRSKAPPKFDHEEIRWIVREARKIVGDRFDLLIDFGCRLNSLEDALNLCHALAPDRFLIFEEPLARDPALYQDFRRQVPIKISGGETLRSTAQFYPWLDGALDLIQPDANLLPLHQAVDVITEAGRKDLKYVPHNWSNPVANSANLQLAGAFSNFVPFVEHNITFNPIRDDILISPIRPNRSGNFIVSTKPGLGISLAEQKLETYMEA
jgi:L-alanine-DL-glutamate epimerase-like enolase superfamily enzyme